MPPLDRPHLINDPMPGRSIVPLSWGVAGAAVPAAYDFSRQGPTTRCFGVPELFLGEVSPSGFWNRNPSVVGVVRYGCSRPAAACK